MSKALQVLFSILTLSILLPAYGAAQATLSGSVLSSAGDPLAFASVSVDDGRFGGTTDDAGVYSITVDSYGNYDVTVSFLGYESITQQVTLSDGQAVMLDFQLNPSDQLIDEVVVTGTLKEVNRLDSPVPVEVYNPGFFKKNPTPNVYEALQNVNGVRPQLNCQVCGTGDIQINGLAGPYTMILIDGMPIVSSLATVYGLSGIPNSLIERMEIVKGPASSLYGSEAIGGLINIITKSPQKASTLTADVMASTWGELNADVGVKQNLGSFASVLTGINYFRFDNVVDNNADNFTDMTLQDRISIFQKWSIHRKDNRLFTIAGRYYNEDRWGGELNWTPAFRGGSEIYGESIRTKRWELLGQYELPTSEHMVASFSFN
ncbi:MAG: TonB-dependent receptor plug domain-containing protein, partial [Bacteroidota bacterium]